MHFLKRVKLAFEIFRNPEVLTHDSLTGALRFEYFLKIFPRVYHRLKKEGWWLIFLDIDGLKEINRKKGYKAGDEYIKKTSKLILENIRATDFFVRLYRGGDEFIIVGKGNLKGVKERLESVFKLNNISVSLAAKESSSEQFSIEDLLVHLQKIVQRKKARKKN